ncbi:MAG: SMC-Scp complex subunit ScpB, partial [Clostridia bacterium]|nr:SMC-Scp complex subunit ScpB [Clostridia bacterium]
KDAEDVVKALQKRMNEQESGLTVIQLDDCYQMTTLPAHIGPIRKLSQMRRNTPLSGAAFEVLSVIAYNQPVTKSYVEQVRGVDCTGVIGSLCAKGLIEECGRLDLPGRPLLYGTTKHFLRCFSLASLEELPPIPQGERDAQQEVTETKMEDFVVKE